ncbi:ABC transporter ATP-binding protein [Phaeobacter sp. PT47_59]|uniref:ABC transporter ATP-binding protein n=1 Tax=Phaeobacter sp. PT47_59 TaxID=3029979 RepID=UPI0023807CA3|nr:ABC transporter ATP-binding protein [Phaeobacter sp. PT47_59]MDE4175406.1 ABC transporter ATP-binding protein [Phaeobacter sp. PT47_59]
MSVVMQKTSDQPHGMEAKGLHQPLFSVEGLNTSFLTDEGWKPVVNDLSFQIEKGKTLAVVGGSGSGKSVTAMSIMQLLRPEKTRIEGKISLEGQNLLDLDDRGMRAVRGDKIAMIFQEPMTSLNPVMSVGRQISETLRLHKGVSSDVARKEALALLDRVRIPSAAARFKEYPHQFSGGMRQRVMIAMALACRPQLLIADEPTTALDVTIQAQILNLIRELQDEEHMSVLFITHDMAVVAEMSDQIIVMQNGQAVENGEAERVILRPEHPYTKLLLAAAPRLGSLEDTPVSRSTTVPAEAKPVVEVKNLTTRFEIQGGLLGRTKGRVHAVEDVSFSIGAGETLGLVGESGCGKSTLGRSIVRLAQPESGTIRIHGQDIMRMDREQLRAFRQEAQFVFQDPFASLNPRSTVGRSIIEPILAHGVCPNSGAALEKAGELMRRVGLSADMLSRFPHEFSGGQRQRICIARALALEPKLIIADESVSALDVSVKAQVVDLLMELQQDLGISYLFISHDMAVVERISHRVAVMYLGEIVEIGPRQSILNNPAHGYTRRLLSAVPVADPSRRHKPHKVSDDELLSPIRELDFVPPAREMREISPGHFVRVNDGW